MQQLAIRLGGKAVKSLVIPLAGEGDKASLREFHINRFPVP